MEHDLFFDLLNCAVILVLTVWGCNLLSIYGEAPKARVAIFIGFLLLLLLHPFFSACILLAVLFVIGLAATLLFILLFILSIVVFFKILGALFK